MDDTPWTDAVDLIVLGQRTEAELRALLEWDQVGRRAADALRAAVGTEDIFTFERGVLAILGVLGETHTFSPFFRRWEKVPAKFEGGARLVFSRHACSPCDARVPGEW